MEYFIVGIIIILLIGSLLAANEESKHNERVLKDINKEKARQEAQRKYEEKAQQEAQKNKELYDSLISRYGECTVSINWKDWKTRPNDNLDKFVLIFEEPKIIIIKSKEYKFSDILGYSLEDNAINETTTFSEGDAKASTGSMLGRAAVGGLLTGGLGAVAGAVTAKKNISTDSVSTTKTTHNYIMYINVNNLQDPVITLCIGNMSGNAQKLASVLNIIIERNKQQ